MRYRNISLAVVFCFLLSPGHAASPGSGGMQFLKIGIGARPISMGEAFTGISNDINALLWNPAGIAQLDTMHQTFMHSLWLEGIGIQYGAFVTPLPKGVLGVGIEYMNGGEISRVNKYGDDVGSYTTYDLMGIVTYAREINGSVSVGGTFKMIEEKIESERAKGFALDAGALYRLARFQIGLAVRNIGSGVQFREKSFPLPLQLRVGIAYPFSDTLTVSADFVPLDTSPGFHLGGEYIFTGIMNTKLALRGGFKTTTIGSFDVLSGVSVGFGVERGLWCVDYALAPYGALGMSHRINVTMRLAPPAAPPAHEPAAKPAEAENELPPQDMYADALLWYYDKLEKEKLDPPMQKVLLERIREKFEPLGVDVSLVKEMLRKLDNERK